MTYGRVFTKMRNLFPTLREADFSDNKFSGLKRTELNKIAHELHADGAWGDRGNYTHMTNIELANNCYNCINSL